MRARGRQWAVAVAAVLLLGGRAAAQTDVDLFVHPGFGDDAHCKPGRWMPVRLVIENRGAEAHGYVSVTASSADQPMVYQQKVRCPTNSRLAYTLYVRQTSDAGPVEAQLFLRGRAPLLKKQTVVTNRSNDKLVLVVSRDAPGLGLLKTVRPGAQTVAESTPGIEAYGPGGPIGLPGEDAEVVMVGCQPDEIGSTGLPLPDRAAGYDAVDVVVLRDIAPSTFTDRQAEALVGWVRLGGTLVVGSSPAASEFARSFVEQLSPVAPRGRQTLQGLPALGQYFGVGPGYAVPTQAVTGPLAQGAEVLVRQEGVPLVARRAYGAGTVWFLAADYGANPLRGWDALQRELWGDIIRHSRGTDVWWASDDEDNPGGPPGSPEGPGTGLWGLANSVVSVGIGPPSFGLIGAFLVLYIIVLVPVNYLVLRKLDRRELAWITSPLIVVAFSVGAYLLGSSIHRGSIMRMEAQIASTVEGATEARTHGAIGIYSPRKQRYDLRTDDPRLFLQPLATQKDEVLPSVDESLEGGAWALKRVPVSMWSTRPFLSEGGADLGGAITSALVRRGQAQVAVTVRNGTRHQLRRTLVVLGNQARTGSNLGPGGEATYDFSQAETTPAAPPVPMEGPRYPGMPYGQQAMSGLFSKVVQQSDARETSTSPDDSRARLQLLREAFGPAGQRLDRCRLSRRPVLIAWADDLPQAITISPRPQPHFTQTLVIAELDGGFAQGPVEFGPQWVRETLVDWSAEASFGAAPGSTPGFQLQKGSVTKELELPARGAGWRLTDLTVYAAHGQGKLNTLIYNFRAGRWETVAGPDPGKVSPNMASPADYVRWPLGVVRLRLDRVGTVPDGGPQAITWQISGRLERAG